MIYDPSLEGWGEYNGQDQAIIVSTLDKPGFQTTVLHELIHAIDDIYNIRLSEQSVRCLEQALALFVRDNPEETLEWVYSFLGEPNEESRLRDQSELPHSPQGGPEDRNGGTSREPRNSTQPHLEKQEDAYTRQKQSGTSRHLDGTQGYSDLEDH